MTDLPRNRVRRVIKVRAGDLAPHPLNWRRHPERQRIALRAMLDEIGFASVVTVVERDGGYMILDGHLRADLDPDLEIDAAVLDLDDAEAEKFLATADPLAGMATPDAARLYELLARADSEREEVRALLASVAVHYGATEAAAAAAGAGGSGDHGTRPAGAPAPQTDRGDVWRCGRHRVMCGDAHDRDDWDRLLDGAEPAAIITDPPYGIGIVGASGTAGNFPGTTAPRLAAAPIIGDDRPFDPAFLLAQDVPRLILWGANHYAHRLPAGSKWLVWDKKDGAFQGSDLGDCELAWTNLGGAARLLHHTWQGMYRAGEGEREARFHPTQKPVDLMVWCIEQSGTPAPLAILDPYAGSGSTLIACERTGHTCYAMEIDPRYVEGAVRRWEAVTGRTAEREAQ